MNANEQHALTKVPEITLLFWLMKIAATTLGETGGDFVSMSLNLGYLVSTGIFATVFIFTVIIQIGAKRFHPMIYWMTIIATTTVGTTLADFADRSLGIGYLGGSTILLVLLLLEATRRSLGPALPIIALLFTAYAFLGPHMPNFFAFKGVSVSKFISNITLSTEGIYGIPLGVAASIVSS